jgi:hypothetical protein
MAEQPAPEETYPRIENGMMVAPFEAPQYTKAQQASALARAVLEAGPRLNDFWPGVKVPQEVLYAAQPLIPMLPWEVFIGIRQGACVLWLAQGDDVAEMVIPEGEQYDDMRTLMLRVLTNRPATS